MESFHISEKTKKILRRLRLKIALFTTGKKFLA